MSKFRVGDQVIVGGDSRAARSRWYVVSQVYPRDAANQQYALEGMFGTYTEDRLEKVPPRCPVCNNTMTLDDKGRIPIHNKPKDGRAEICYGSFMPV